jgi:hypothetical protein
MAYYRFSTRELDFTICRVQQAIVKRSSIIKVRNLRGLALRRGHRAPFLVKM